MLVLLVYISFLFSRLLLVTDDPQIIISFWPFHVGLLYILAGIFIGRPVLIIGCWLILAAVAGVWLPPLWQQIWLAAGGGGSLILTGVNMRKQVIKDE
jgi:hypothetical protein